jgi:hypothetical protein
MEGTDFNMFNQENLNPREEEEYKDRRLDNGPEATSMGMDILRTVEVYWSNLDELRTRRTRSRNYYRGKQWSDLITDPDNPTASKITEENYLLKTGKQPTVNNQILQVMKNMKGQFRDNDYKPMAISRTKDNQSASEMMSNAIQYVYDYNRLKELDTSVWEEFLLSGVIGWKSGYEWDRQRNLEEVKNYAVSVPRMFWNNDVRDIRMEDLRLVGEMHDAHWDELVSAFATNEEEEKKLMELYSQADQKDRIDHSTQIGSDSEDGLDFYQTTESHLMRFFEIWRLEKRMKVFYHDILQGESGQHVLDVEDAIEEIEYANQQRYIEFIATVFQVPFEEATEEMMALAMETVPPIQYEVRKEDVWCYYYLTPHGHILKSGETPYEHESHPYTLRLFPLLDGEVWGFIESIIDQQRNINRYLIIMDFMLTSSAKGVLMVPETALGKYTPDQFADQWVRHNGVIVYDDTKRTGAKPEQITANSQSPAATQLLSIQLDLLKEISGVSEAIQGQKPSAGTPASLYAQMTANSTIASRDYFEFFFSARRERDFKNLQTVLQAWQEERYINVTGKDYDNEAYIFDPQKVEDSSFDIVIGKSNNAPVFRNMIDDYLFQFLMNGLVDLPMFLDNTSLPFSSKLQEQFEARQKALEAQQGMAGGVQPGAGGQMKTFPTGDQQASGDLINQFMGKN